MSKSKVNWINILTYFEIVLQCEVGGVISNQSLEDPIETEEHRKEAKRSLKKMPLQSTCGHDCKLAIDAARTLLESVVKATGSDSSDCRLVQLACLNTILIFING